MKAGLLALLLTSAIAVPTVHADGQAPVDERLHDIIAQTDADNPAPAPGCALAVYRDGHEDTFLADGQADIENARPIDGDTLFYAASVSKQFTALAIAQLADDGRLALDDPVRTYIPELPRYRHPVTIRMLLHHSAGIRDSLTLLRLSGHKRNSATAKGRALALLFEQQDTNFPPGTATGYSNGGYLLLAELVERVAGEPFPDYVRRAILEPIGMRDSFILDDAPPESPHLAHGYVRNGDGFERRDTYPLFGGSGGLMLTLNDLARYEYDIERGHRVWTPSIRRIMTRPGALADDSPAIKAGTNRTYAAGLQIGEHRGHRTVQHGGASEAFRHMYVRVPDRRLAVAVFCNRSDRSARDMTHAAIDELLDPAPDHVSDAPEPGRYRARELQAEYRLESDGDTVRLAIVANETTDESPAWTLRRTDEGTYEGEDMTLRPRAERDGFTLDSKRARGLKFVRVAE